MIGKKIVSLRFDTWAPYTVNRIGYTQPLFGFAELLLDSSREQGIRERSLSPSCSCCDSPMVLQESEAADEMDDAGTRTAYWACRACGFWRFHLRDNVSLGYDVIPSIREFNVLTETPALLQLSAEVMTHPQLLYGTDPFVFERFVGSVLAAFFDCEVHHVGRTGDDGIDLLAVVKDEPLMIQVKRRSSSRAVEGVNVVKLLFASAFARGGRRGAVVTTAARFSRSSQKWARSPRLVDTGFQFQLIDFASLMSMVDCVAKKSDPPPWLLHKHREQNHYDSASPWILKTYPTHDCLTRDSRGDRQALIFDHRLLENCALLTGATGAIEAFIAAWRPPMPVKAPGLTVSIRRTDWALEAELGVKVDVAVRLTSRWIRLYPGRVLDGTP